MFELSLPKMEAFATKKVRGYTRKCSPDEQQKQWEQACRSRWRALVPGADGGSARFATLAIKAIQETYSRGTPPLLGSGT